jgi:outer membrane protein TolC
LQKLLAKTVVREKAREVTQTDLDQVRLRLETARNQELFEQASLKVREASYERAIGAAAGNLASPPTHIVSLPPTLDTALAEADHANPSLAEARTREVSAQHALDVARGEMFPDVFLRLEHSREGEVSNVTNSAHDTVGEVRVNFKLFDGGDRMAQIEQAKLDQLFRTHATADTKLEVDRALKSAWGRLDAARRQLDYGRRRIEFAKKALAGVRTEEAVGQRSLIDVLNAENELVEAELALYSSERDVVVEGFTIISLIGGVRVFDLVDKLDAGEPAPRPAKMRTAEMPDLEWHTVTRPEQ